MKVKDSELFCKLIIDIFLRSSYYCISFPVPGMCYFSYVESVFVNFVDRPLISLVKGLGSARK
jgi:hypothetical protein